MSTPSDDEAARLKKIDDAFKEVSSAICAVDFQHGGNVSWSNQCKRAHEHLKDARLWAREVARQPEWKG